MQLIRQPAVAGRFYPGDPERLHAVVVDFFGQVEARPALGVVSPHAGYVYSGLVAGATFAQVEIPESVVVLCPKHTRMGAHSAIMDEGSWALPSGLMPIDEVLAAHLCTSLPGLEVDSRAHAGEHSLEVQLPFLQERRRDVRFVPIALGYRTFAECQVLGKALGEALAAWVEPVLIVASSDMNHYEDQETTIKKDMQAIERFLALDAAGLYELCEQLDISMCGVIPAAVMLIATKHLGAIGAELVSHRTSGDVSGDYGQVVGYAGMIVR